MIHYGRKRLLSAAKGSDNLPPRRNAGRCVSFLLESRWRDLVIMGRSVCRTIRPVFETRPVYPKSKWKIRIVFSCSGVLIAMAICSYPLSHLRIRGWPPLIQKPGNPGISVDFKYYSGRNRRLSFQSRQCYSTFATDLSFPISDSEAGRQIDEIPSPVSSVLSKTLALGDLDPSTAKILIGLLGPFLTAFSFLFIFRIVMSWYPKLPVEKFPYVIAYVPTEPLLLPTRKLIPPVGGVDVTPVVWFGLLSFLNEILLGPQGLLVLLSQQGS